MSVSPCDSCTKKCTHPECGCKDWKNWFLRTWNENICRLPREQKTRQVFTYEHPDRVREMAPKNPEEMTAAEWMAMKMEANHAK